MAKMNKERLNTWDRKILRRIYGHVVEQGIWRTRTNQEFRVLRIDIDLKAADRTSVRMDHGRVVKKIF